MNLAADAFFAPRVSAVLLEGFRRDMARPLTARIHALDRRILKIEGDMARAQQFMERQEEGELLKANLSHVKKGTKRIEVEDWYKGGKRIIELDPALDAVANMERIFKRAAKGKRGEKIVQERLRETLEEKAALQDLLFFVEAAQNLEELNRLAPEIPAFLTKGRPESPAEKNRKQEASAGLYRTFRTPGGLVVFVGRSARGNDSLIREKARKGDLWFHAKGTPGAHVLLPVRGEGSPTEKDKEFAAGLAVYFSKARGKGKTEVIVADVKDIGHPKGAASGQVTVRKYATIVSEGSEEL
jgi:predicted ribosome quality control (RQC) complex YloA/Tae2 family protein